MEIQQFLKFLRRYWRSALAVLLLCIAAAAGLTLLQTPSYSATSSVFLTVDSGGSAGELSQGATYAERTVTSYVKVATTEVVLRPVIDELGLNTTLVDLREDLTISSPTGTSILNVTARDDDPEQAWVNGEPACPAVNGNGSPSPEPWPGTPTCLSSTSRPRLWTAAARA